MDIVIRNLDPTVVKSIDEKAKKMGQSRQIYMRDMVENHVMLKELNDREKELKVTLEKCMEVINYAGDQMEKNNELINELVEEV